MGPEPTQHKHRAVVAVALAKRRDLGFVRCTRGVNANGVGWSFPGVRRASARRVFGQGVENRYG